MGAEVTRWLGLLIAGIIVLLTYLTFNPNRGNTGSPFTREEFIFVFWIVPGLVAFIPHGYSLHEAWQNRAVVHREDNLSAYVGDGMVRLIMTLMLTSGITVAIGLAVVILPPSPSSFGAGLSVSTVVVTLGLCAKEAIAAVMSLGMARWLYQGRQLAAEGVE